MADDPPAIGACWDPLAGRLAASAVHVGGAWLFFFVVFFFSLVFHARLPATNWKGDKWSPVQEDGCG